MLFAGLGAGQQAKPQTGAEATKLIESIDGPTLYYTYCAACHGMSGKGGGPMATSLKTPPSDLTRLASKAGGDFPLAKVEKIIAGDENVAAGHGMRGMPLWGPIFSQVTRDQDLGKMRIRNLSTYLKSLQGR